MLDLMSQVELELQYVGTRERDRELELARQLGDGRRSRVSPSQRLRSYLGQVLIGWGEALRQYEVA